MSDDESDSPKVAIGIAFGNSYSSVAKFLASDIVVIANEEGDRQIPSVLSYVEGEEYNGTQAKAQLVRNRENTVVGFRDFIGKSFDSIDPRPCTSAAHPLKNGNNVAFKIQDNEEGKENEVTVSEVTTRHLRRLKNSASDYLGKDVSAAVMAVPTEFTDANKAALTEAAKNAGIEVLQFVHEPVAALLAYDKRSNDQPADKITVVVDLGGTRSDVTVISTRGGMYSILATAHDFTLGGASLDDTLIEYAAKEFQKRHKIDPRQNERGLTKLKLEAEAVRKALSLGNSASFNIESLAEGIDYSLTVNRTRFELLAGKVFARFTRLIDDTIAKAELDPLDIDDVLLCGGTSHTPRIATNLQSHFAESANIIAPATLPTAPNPSELTARGAALQAYLVQGFDTEDIDQSTHPMVTVTPHLSHAIGVAIEGPDGTQVFQPIIHAETPLPVRRTVQFPLPGSAPAGPQDYVVRVCEGETDIKVTKPEPKAKPETNGKQDDDDDDDDDDDSDEDEEEDTREKIWKVGTLLGELAVRGLDSRARINLQIQVGADLSVSIAAMEVQTGKHGVKGTISGREMNGAAH